ncbi:hypothetical protein RJT34_19763 [Clitoria ternatea]|uniref:Uncharacterized protein n=1 Tax=Clitoria ternatea TaxID=43366 RepID=A0AAN9IRM9_CLITE
MVIHGRCFHSQGTQSPFNDSPLSHSPLPGRHTASSSSTPNAPSKLVLPHSLSQSSPFPSLHQFVTFSGDGRENAEDEVTNEEAFDNLDDPPSFFPGDEQKNSDFSPTTFELGAGGRGVSGFSVAGRGGFAGEQTDAAVKSKGFLVGGVVFAAAAVVDEGGEGDR